MTKKGFTLIEVLVVIFIIGFLSVIIVVGTGYAREKSRDGQRIAYLTEISGGLNKYYLDNGEYPACVSTAYDDEFDNLVTALSGNYIGTNTLSNPFPLDRSNNVFNYCADNPGPDFKYNNDFWLWFRPEITQLSTCDNVSGNPDSIYLIKNSKVSNQW